MRKKAPSQGNNNSDFGADAKQSIWRSAILNGNVELLTPLLRDGFTANSPLNDLGRSPLIDIALLVPDNADHAEALAETARALINAGATLNLPDYKGLVPADYALASPNPLVARQIILSTMRNEIYKGLEKSYRPQLNVLFCLAMCKPERRALHDNIADNLVILREALRPEYVKEDPLLLAQETANFDFWNNLQIKDIEDCPKESAAMRQQFRRVAAMEALAHKENTANKEVVSVEELAEEQNQYRFLEWRHAKIFHIQP